MADNLRLVIMTFPQVWMPGSSTLTVNALLVPSVSPVDDALVGSGPKFADHVPNLKAVVIPNLDGAPKTSDPTAVVIAPTIVQPNPPAVTRPNYNKLLAQAAAQGLTVSGAGGLSAPTASTIRKALPQSYVDATGSRPGAFTVSVDAFGCELKNQPVYQPGKKPTTTGWGPLISYALRQPLLATALGLRYEMEIKLSSASALKDGGWLFFALDASDPWAAAAAPGQIRLYAARLPALSKKRQVFAAVLFPVDAAGAIDDAAFSTAETYDDGFAQVVHTSQPQANDAVTGNGDLPAASDAGIQVGWDDEQVTAWQNGQIQMLNDRLSGGLDAQTPLGVLGYRVDVADVTAKPAKPDWHSLVKADVTLPQGMGHYRGELYVEPTALRPHDPANPTTVQGDAWLPLYFASWRGGSLVSSDNIPKAMLDGKPIKAQPDPVGVLLSYGHSYAFRVRLADLSSGGPEGGDNPVNVDPADVSSIDFRRAVPPKKPGVKQNYPASSSIPASLTFTRPLLGYPEALYTALGDTDAHRRQIVEFLTKNSKPGSGNVVGLPDPDMATLELTVEVRAPIHDVAGDGVLDLPFRVLYTTTRAFPPLPGGPLPADPGLNVDLAYVDAPSILDWEPVQPASGPLVIPRARDVRITARAITRDDPAYFYPTAVNGLTASLTLRAELRDEGALLISPVSGEQPLRGFLFKRPPGIAAPSIPTQMAQSLGLVSDGLSFSARPGQRVVFGASKSLRHSLSGDNSSITFASESEMLGQWVLVLMVDLERDWTWDGLANANTLSVDRDGEIVGSLVVAQTLGQAAVSDLANWDRARSLLVFFDGVDPHEVTASGFPEARTHAWRLTADVVKETGAPVGVAGAPTLKPGALPPPVEPELNGAKQPLKLPIAVPPAQIPEIASVGLALSPYAAGPGYATTEQRVRGLWIELKESVQNEAGDALYARILGHGADPLLYRAIPSTDQPAEPPLALNPELIRQIVPGESDTCDGADAMILLTQASNSKKHFLLPLPDGVDPSNPELFGFYTYELRVGHKCDPNDGRWWSTAQARFGRALRVNGVQHPAPPLVCRAGRPFVKPGPNAVPFILATATYATPVLNGTPLVRPFEPPRTSLYFFLYAQVVQADAASNRNLLLFQRKGIFLGRERTVAGGLALSQFTAPLSQRDRIGAAAFTEAEVELQLRALGLPPDLPLSVLAVEFLPGGVGDDLPPALNNEPAVRSHLNAAANSMDTTLRLDAAQPEAAISQQNPDPLNLNGHPRRILRVSPLVKVEPPCD